MILYHNLNFFDKNGKKLNLNKIHHVLVTINRNNDLVINYEDAIIEVLTNVYGYIESFHIAKTGTKYDENVSILITDTESNVSYTIDSAEYITLGSNGEILNILLPNPVHGFGYPSITYEGNVFFQKSSIGLFETSQIYILEEMVDVLSGDTIYSSPRTYTDLNNSVSTKLNAKFIDTDDKEIDLFNVNYDDDKYPYIENIHIASIALDDGIKDSLINNKRQVTLTRSNIIYFNVLSKSDKEGIFERILNIYEIVEDNEYIIATINFRSEVIGEDERLRSMLENFGIQINLQELKIFRDSDINEELPNYLLLNQKRKEMLLEYHNIFPYIGSYKGLINIINYFGYGDTRLKEYWLNVKKTNTINKSSQKNITELLPIDLTSLHSFGNAFKPLPLLNVINKSGTIIDNTISSFKDNNNEVYQETPTTLKTESVNSYNLYKAIQKGIYLPEQQIDLIKNINNQYFKQIEVPMQLAQKGKHWQSEEMLPNKVWKKTNLFGLFYDITRESGNFDEYGTPITEDTFMFSEDEVLLKLFGLREYLKEKFMPLNARIIDIVGEGIYFERWTTNIWKDDILNIDINKNKILNFKIENGEGLILDIQDYGVPTDCPKSGDNIANFKNVFINNLMQNPALFKNDNGPIGCKTQLTIDNFEISWDEMNITWDELHTDTRSIRRAYASNSDFYINYISGIITINYKQKNNEIIPGFTEIVLHSTVGSPPQNITQTLQVLEENPISHNNETFIFSTLWADMFFIDKESGWIVDGSQGRTYKTLNSGKTWTLMYNSPAWLEAVEFLDKDYGWVAGDNIAAYTEDGGDTWNQITLPWSSTTSWVRDLELISNDHIVLSGHNITAVSFDKGDTWILPSNIIEETYDLQFLNENLGFQTGDNTSGNGQLSKSIDGGQTWTNIYEDTENNFRTVYFFDENIGLLAGDKKIFRTVDGGQTWDTIFTWNFGSYGRNFNFVNKNIGYISGENGFLAKTIDGGRHWVLIETNSTAKLNVVQYFDEDHGHWLFDDSTGRFWYGYQNTILVKSNGDLSALDNAWFEYAYYKNNLSTNTWDTIAQGENYEVEWLIEYENPERFSYNVRGITNTYKDISVDLPFAGSYNATCIMYDLTNHSVKKTKKIDVKMPIVDFMCFGRAINPVGIWDDLNNVTWDDLNSEWRNPAVSNKLIWDDLDGLSWDDLDFEKYIDQSNPFEETSKRNILRISEYDRYVGNLVHIEFDENLLFIEGQYKNPGLRPAIGTNIVDHVFLRNGNTVNKVGVIDVSYKNNQTLLTTNSLPIGIDNTWDVLREVGKTVLFEGDITDNTNNIEGITPGQYISFEKRYDSFIKKGIRVTNIIQTLDVNGIVIDSQINKIKSEYGTLYKKRNLHINDTPGFSFDSENKTITLYFETEIDEIIPGFTTLEVTSIVNERTISQRLLVLSINGSVLTVDELDSDMGLMIYASSNEISYDYWAFTVKLRQFINDTENNNEVYFNFNDYPYSTNFVNEVLTGYELNGDWLFDYAIKDGEFAIEIINVGFENGNTLVTFNDPNSELYRISPLFTPSWISFDEDYAKQRFGTKIFNWDNMNEITWDKMEHLTWNMIEYQKVPLCEFRITNVEPSGIIRFNELPFFQFINVPPISNLVSKYDQFEIAVDELNNTENESLQRFRYTLLEDSNSPTGYYISAIAKSEGIYYLGYLKFEGGITGDKDDPSISHTYPVGTWEDWINPYIYGLDNQYAPWNPVARAYYEFGYDYSDNKGWYPADNIDDNNNRYIWNSIKNKFLSYDPIDLNDNIYAKFPALLNSVEWRFDAGYKLLYDYAIVSPFTWNDLFASQNALEINKMTTIFFIPRNKKVAGKQTYRWIISNYETGIQECIVTKPYLIWTFSKQGVYDVSLEIIDINKNMSINKKQGYITVK